MLVLVGPSASGKSAIVKKLVSEFGLVKFITCTTRKPRVGEINGVDYYFMSEDEFTTRYANDEFIETVFYNGNYYGTLKKEVGIDKVVILEPQGLCNFTKHVDNLFSVYLYTDEQKLRDRMLYRGDSLLEVEKRLQNDRILFSEEQLGCVNLKIDTTNLSIIEISSKVFEEYKNFCKK